MIETASTEPVDVTADDRPSPRPLADLDDQALLALVRHDDTDSRAARRELIARYRPLVLARAARLHRDRDSTHDDVVSCGWVGLLKAVRDYDVTRGTPFAAYADAKVVGEMMRWFRDDRYVAHVPRPAHERAMQVAAAVRELESAGDTAPDLSTIARLTGLTEDEVDAALTVQDVDRTRRSELAVDVPATDDDDPTARMALDGALERLEDDDRQLLVARYWDGITQRRLGRTLGVSQAHVSRLEHRALSRLRQALLGPPRDPDDT